jgi:murein DD-endopeptidase MepM/ murein hydrolase activator NlpD
MIITISFVLALLLAIAAMNLGRGQRITERDTANLELDDKPQHYNPDPDLVFPVSSDPAAIIVPYDEYIVTQGIHGLSYGHMAIDIAAGKGAIVKSPISGIVTEYFIDGVGNPTLIIENNRYRVTLLHGVYEVDIGDSVEIGMRVGVEGNIGNTRDMQGNSCRNRNCGYHTHLNIFDKQASSNVNPIELLGL